MPQSSNNKAGSHANSEPAFLVLGKLRRAHGVRGEIPLELHSQMLELMAPGCQVFVGEGHHALTIEATRWKNELLLLKFEEIDNREDVSQWTNSLLYVRSEQLPELPDGEFYLHQLVGMDVYEPDGTYLGVLTEILETGANDVYLIEDEAGEEVLIPATEEMILEIDLDQEKMVVAKMAWYGEGE
ncbi:ribosome maturation factor RimM [bacterium]|nr:ribosome maturation factor RimM [bacterium]